MTVVSYFTGNGRYEELAERLLASCNKFSVPCRILKMPDAGRRTANTGGKPSRIMDLLLQTRGPVCWIDADAYLVADPVLLRGGNYDFAVYNWRADPENTLRLACDYSTLTSSTGVVAFGYTAGAMELLLRWSNRIDASPIGDDLALDEVYNQTHPPVRPLWLPKAYNRMSGMWPHVQPVVDHEWTDGGHAEVKNGSQS